MNKKKKHPFLKKRISRSTQEETSDSQKEEEIEKSLTAIYQDESGKMPDLTRIDPARSRWWAIALFTIVLFVICSVAVTMTYVFFTKPFRGFSGDALHVAIEGPDQISVGKEETYLVTYKNQTTEPLARTELRITFPSDFIVRSREPAPTEGDFTWRLGSLGVGESGVITIQGTFTGALGTASAIQVVGTYRPASFNSDFETLATTALMYSGSVLQGELHLPEKVLPGDHVSFTYTVENTGEEDLQALVSRMTLPSGFTVESAIGKKDPFDEAVDSRVLEFEIGTLGAGSSTEIGVVGSFSTNVSGNIAVSAETGRKNDADLFLPAERSESTMTVLAGDLSLKLVVNGEDTELKTAYGSVLRFASRYENTSSEDLNGVTLRLVLEPEDEMCTDSCTVDWGTYSDSATGTLRNGGVRWDEKHVPGLSRLIPREEGGIDISVDALPLKDGASGLAFRAYLEAHIQKIGNTVVDRVVKSSSIRIRYISDVSLTSEARYFLEEGAPVGSGPLPPVVGSSTTYRIEWTVAKSFHDLENIKVHAPLSSIGSWAGDTSVNAGVLQYNEASKEVVWTLNRMPENVAEARASFDVTITPSDADLNRFAKILGESRFESKDTTAEYSVIQTRPEITTDLSNDEYANGKGVVRNSK